MLYLKHTIRIQPPEFFKKQYAVDEAYYTEDVSNFCSPHHHNTVIIAS